MSPVALTFDDGPDLRWTPPVLDAVANAGVTATFFVVAEQIREPGGGELLSAIVDAGHGVQPHCARHVRHTELGLEALREDIGGVLDALADHGVTEPRLWRPPYGVLHPPYSGQVAAEAGLELELWTHDPLDYDGTDPKQMLVALDSIESESVILLHDSRRYTQRTSSAANTIALIDPLVALIRARGYTVAPL